MEVILSLIIRKGIMILSHKNDEQFQGALKDLVRSHFWIECMQSQYIAGLAEGLSKHWHTKCFLWSGLVCPDVAIICLRGGGVSKGGNISLSNFLSCIYLVIWAVIPAQMSTPQAHNQSVEAIFYQWDFHFHALRPFWLPLFQIIVSVSRFEPYKMRNH